MARPKAEEAKPNNGKKPAIKRRVQSAEEMLRASSGRAPKARDSGKRQVTAPSRPKPKGPQVQLPNLKRRKGNKRLSSFAELGWRCAEDDEATANTDTIAIDIGSEGTCTTWFDQDFRRARDKAHPTMVLVGDPHAFRTLEPFSLEVGLPALERWPNDRVLRGTHGSILLPSQIGLVEFPVDHVLAGLTNKLRHDLEREPRQVALTLPTFMASELADDIRAEAAPYRKGAFRGVPSAIASAWFYLAPAFAEAESPEGDLCAWSKRALEAGRVLVLDWGASGLQYGLVTVREPGAGRETEGNKTELRLALAGTWPSLGGHRLTLTIVRRIHRMLTDRILESGPSDDLIRRPLFEPRSGFVPRPVGYEEAFDRLRRIGTPMNEEERAEVAQLRNLLLPTRWRFGPGEEPVGYSPFRKIAIEHFRGLWGGAERIKRLIFSDPRRYLERGTIAFNADVLDSPFVSDLEDRVIEVPVKDVLGPIERNLRRAIAHIARRLRAHLPKGAAIPVGLTGMQAGSRLLRRTVKGAAKAGVAENVALAPTSSDPLELKSTVNRGAALLFRDKRHLDFGPVPEVLPFSVQIADCLGNITVFTAGPLDELAVFQRRIRVESGFPQFEFLLYESEDGTQRGAWGCIDFNQPFEFTEEDQTISVDPRYGFRDGVPTLRELRGDEGVGLELCFDRADKTRRRGLISFRRYAPRNERARQLLHFLEHGLKGSFHRKVYLLEREFPKPPKRFDFVYQRYYLSRSQELLVVREWWAPTEGGKLLRNKTLHTCQGTTEANTILGLEWGTY